jgi:hypothetical protein
MNITRKKAGNKANQSSDLRQKMRKPIPLHTNMITTKKIVRKAAYSLAEKPSGGAPGDPLR